FPIGKSSAMPSSGISTPLSWYASCPLSSRANSRSNSMMNTEVIKILNDLIETCRDGQEGFRSAADSIGNSEFRRMFNIFSQQRAQFVNELESEVHRLGGKPERKKGLTSSLYGWMDVRIADSGNEGSIIAVCQRGEEIAVTSYHEALMRDLPL